MIRRRKVNTGLPYRVYERWGTRIWRIWYQPPGGARDTLFECMAKDVTKAEARRRAIVTFQRKYAGQPESTPEVLTFQRLGEIYFDWQDSLPDDDEGKKAASTLEENRREFATLCAMHGPTLAEDLQAPDWFRFQDARRKAGSGKKANKELALASKIMEYGRLRGMVPANTARIPRIPTQPGTRRVELEEIDAVLAVARTIGPAATRQALCARAAMLCTRRSTEIRALTTAQVTDAGIEFVASKRKAGAAERRTTIEWSPQLKWTIDEAAATARKVDISPFVFCTEDGREYTRSGWGTSWRRLMLACLKQIDGFERFSLQDCRPAGVTNKKERGDSDTLDATLHADGRMVERIYDRRRTRKAKPAA